MGAKETFMTVATSSALIIAVALLCYNSLYAVILLSPYIYIHLKRKKGQLKEKRKWELNIQFGEMIKSLSAVLESGYSVENAVTETYHDLKLTFDDNAMIMTELKTIMASLKSNVPIEKTFEEFAARSGVDDVKSFSDVFSTAKRTGGNIISIIRSTALVIRTRVELKRELRTMIASKKYESDIMRMIPFAILLYLRVFSPDMVGALYGNTFGVVFMTVILVIYIVFSMIADRIVNITF